MATATRPHDAAAWWAASAWVRAAMMRVCGWVVWALRAVLLGFSNQKKLCRCGIGRSEQFGRIPRHTPPLLTTIRRVTICVIFCMHGVPCPMLPMRSSPILARPQAGLSLSPRQSSRRITRDGRHARASQCKRTELISRTLSPCSYSERGTRVGSCHEVGSESICKRCIATAVETHAIELGRNASTHQSTWPRWSLHRLGPGGSDRSHHPARGTRLSLAVTKAS